MSRGMGLVLLHEGTGTVVALADDVYLIDIGILGGDVLERLLDGMNVHESEHHGVKLNHRVMWPVYDALVDERIANA